MAFSLVNGFPLAAENYNLAVLYLKVSINIKTPNKHA
jgi:hypothetical protein